ncbi:hypothetical protein C6497_13530 [Candidatus Poribacteria bacterium]|nr:MAG: hypothetical protein C6497_13530 [Candidatus Poribacteria bacterium]
MVAVVIDTNVIVIANVVDDDDRKNCRDLCIERLNQIITQKEIIVIDDGWRILTEYIDNTKPNTKKGFGDMFVKRLLQNQSNSSVCRIVQISSVAGNGTEFNEFPDDPRLQNFDPDDRKFIAVSIAYFNQYQENPSVLLAIDRGWLLFIDTLHNHGVKIELICEDDMHHIK